MEQRTQLIELNEREARLALDAITRQHTTIELINAIQRQAHMMGETAQKRLDDTLEAVLAMHDTDLPRGYSVRLTGTTLELVTMAEMGQHGIVENRQILDSLPQDGHSAA